MHALFVRLTAHPDKAAELALALEEQGLAVQDEVGTIIWGVHTVPDAQDEFWLYELYESDSSYQAHRNSESMATLRSVFDRCLAKPPEVVVGRPISMGKGILGSG